MYLNLSHHFCENWQERVGKWPTVEEVSHFIHGSIKIQNCRDLKDKSGRHFRMLAIFWNPDLDLIMKIDTVKNTAVTVMSRYNLKTHKQVKKHGRAVS